MASKSNAEDIFTQAIGLSDAAEQAKYLDETCGGDENLRAELAELGYFAGLANQKAAELLDISPATPKRHWAYARAWLYRRIQSQD